MSAASILSQSVPCLLVARPGARQPVQMTVKLTIGASGAPTVATGTVPGVTVAQSGTDGIYTLTFPAGRDMWAIHGAVWPTAPETVTEGRVVNINVDPLVTAATLGKIEFYTAKYDGTEDADLPPVSGSEIHFDWWMDYG